uniref:ORF66a n=1 Tax=Pinus koraiensis TaxID=88728 RepID=A4QM24_PINKO|nr:ORF66a [Pinus koraiensis]ABP35351.1 ORF66a [Pinus koraiensis]
MIRRDVAQLGSVFVLGTKCRRFKSCHPYLSLLFYGKKGTKDHLISIRREHQIIESYQMRKYLTLRV